MTFKNITVTLPAHLLEQGLTEDDLAALSRRWLAAALYTEGRLSAAEAGQLLEIGREEFLDWLDEAGILYRAEARIAPPLARVQETEQQIATLAGQLASLRARLSQMQAKLSRAERVRTDFIATVSHELRTPLNSIIGFAKLLLNQQIGPLNQIQHTDISIIYDSAKHLLSLVNDILDLSKIEAGKIRLDMEWVSIEEIIVGVIASTYILIENKPIELLERLEPGLPRVFADRIRIRQVVINLLSNAAKFTDQGVIKLSVKQIKNEGKDFICFTVQDTGIGISPEDLDKVFEPFRQIDSSDGRRAEGTGLGMPISYRLVKLHGGNLWVESAVGQGSTFYFTLPVQPPSSISINSIHADYRLSE